MRPTRVLLAVSAAALLSAACGDDTTGSAAPATTSGAGTPSASAPASTSGGGLAALPATEILAKASAALKAAPSVHLKGSGSSGGQTFEIDMRYGKAAQAVGTVTANKQKIELRRDGRSVYVKADAAFWQSTGGAAAARLLAGKWLKAPLGDQRVAGLAAFTDKDQFTSGILKADGTVTKAETKTIRGVEAIGLRSSGAQGGGILYIASTGDPVPLQIVPEAGGGDAGQLDFLDYGKTVDVQAPPASQVVDASKLGG